MNGIDIAYISRRIGEALGPDVRVAETPGGGLDIYRSSLDDRPAAYVDRAGAVHTLPRGGAVAANVRAALKGSSGGGSSPQRFVNLPYCLLRGRA
jgi:phage gp37-like protein